MESFNGIVIEDDQTVDQAVDVRNLQIYGNAVFRSRVDAESVEIFGTGRFRSFVTCDDLEIPGDAVMLERLLAETVKVEGSLCVAGKSRMEAAVIDGSAVFMDKLTAARCVLHTRGRLEADGGLKVERFVCGGKLIVPDTLTGDMLDVTSCEQSEIARVNVYKIKVAYKPRGDVPEIREGEFLLSAYFIDAEELDLEYVAADVVECDRAVIGPGCRIGELSYREDVKIDRYARVERVMKI